jgi:hypothetical protein
MILGVGLIGTVRATVAAWFINRHSRTDIQPADLALVDGEPAAVAVTDELAGLLHRHDENGGQA